MYEAVCDGDLAGINALLRMGCGVNDVFDDGDEECTALGWAMVFQQEEAVRLLLTAGADVHLEQHTEEGRVTPIHFVVEYGQADMVELLIKAGVSVHKHLDESQWTQQPRAKRAFLWEGSTREEEKEEKGGEI